MFRTIKIEIYCEYCGSWFDSPINYEYEVSKNFSSIIGHIVSCPQCRHIMVCNKEKMKLSFTDNIEIPESV